MAKSHNLPSLLPSRCNRKYHPTYGAQKADNSNRFLLPHETVVHATPGHLRRDVLRGLVKTDRPVALCLTSRGRLLAMQASSRRGWRTERVLALSGLNDDDSASETETTASDKQKPTRPTPKVTAERGERVVKLEAGTGSDSRCFTLRTVSPAFATLDFHAE